MPDQLSRHMLKRKVLDRWENEGGKICVDLPGIMKSGSPRDLRAGEGHATLSKAGRGTQSKITNAA